MGGIDEIVRKYYFLDDPKPPTQKALQKFKAKLLQYRMLSLDVPQVLDQEMTKMAVCIQKANLLILNPTYQTLRKKEKQYKRYGRWIFAIPTAASFGVGGLLYAVTTQRVSLIGFLLGMTADLGGSLFFSCILQHYHQQGLHKRQNRCFEQAENLILLEQAVAVHTQRLVALSSSIQNTSVSGVFEHPCAVLEV